MAESYHPGTIVHTDGWRYDLLRGYRLLFLPTSSGGDDSLHDHPRRQHCVPTPGILSHGSTSHSPGWISWGIDSDGTAKSSSRGHPLVIMTRGGYKLGIRIHVFNIV